MKVSRTLLGALAGVVVATGVAAASWYSPYYYVQYYSDASLTVEVGSDVQGCMPSGQIINNFRGQQTQFYTQDLIGYCQPGGDIN